MQYKSFSWFDLETSFIGIYMCFQCQLCRIDDRWPDCCRQVKETSPPLPSPQKSSWLDLPMNVYMCVNEMLIKAIKTKQNLMFYNNLQFQISSLYSWQYLYFFRGVFASKRH